MALWERSWIRAKGFEFKIYTIHIVEFKLLSLLYDLK